MSIQIKESAVVYDVIIIGSGAGGGMAFKTLVDAGLRVLLLEAGPDYDPANPKQQTQLKWPYESPRRGASTKRDFSDFIASYGGFTIDGEPYTNSSGSTFDWYRSRMLGGRTNHWGRISLRFGPDDFKRRSIDGLGDDWPIGYDEISPFYDRVDKMIGVFGTKEKIYNEPDGYFLPPPKPRLHELMIKKAGDRLRIPVIANRMSVLTRPINKQRGVCFFCSQCSRGCIAHADFSSSTSLVKPVKDQQHATVLVNAMAREILTDRNGLATGVSYVDKTDMREYQVKGRVIILAASACESARLLLNSSSTTHPNGLANSSDVVGKYLHDSTGASRAAFVPDLIDRKVYNEDGVGGAHLYIPWWLDNKKLDFSRGYHIELGGGLGMPMYGFGWGIEQMNGVYLQKEAGGYGADLKNDYRRLYGAVVSLAGRGESIARQENRCEIDPHTVDKYGIPVLKFTYKWTDQERKQARHMHDTFEEIFDAMGATALGKKPDHTQDYGLATPGRIIHEVGTTRMGNNKKDSVLNKFNQAHDVRNLFVLDGGAFVSQPHKNPTWTILALSLRASEYIIGELKKRNL